MTEGESRGRIVLLAGERGAGKTTCCIRLAGLLASAGLRSGGFVSRRVVDPLGTTRLHLVDLETGEERMLADTQGGLPGPRVGRFQMDAATLAWGVALARRAREARADLIVLDEIGPLELEQRLGFAPLVGDLESDAPGSGRSLYLLVVRAWLATALAERLSRHVPSIVRLTPENRDALPGTLIGLLPGVGSTDSEPPASPEPVPRASQPPAP